MLIKKMVRSSYGQVVMAVLLGFGLSTLFRKSCKEGECLDFKGPPLDKVNDHVFKFDTKCYKFTSVPATCDASKRIVSL
jgi:hypothetical protein